MNHPAFNNSEIQSLLAELQQANQKLQLLQKGDWRQLSDQTLVDQLESAQQLTAQSLSQAEQEIQAVLKQYGLGG
jgi:hypothetical protein